MALFEPLGIIDSKKVFSLALTSLLLPRTTIFITNIATNILLLYQQNLLLLLLFLLLLLLLLLLLPLPLPLPLPLLLLMTLFTNNSKTSEATGYFFLFFSFLPSPSHLFIGPPPLLLKNSKNTGKYKLLGMRD